MRSIVKKCSMVFALAAGALAVVAAPVDFIPRNSLAVVTVNTNKVIDNQMLSGMLAPKLNAEFQKNNVPLTFNDLRGQLAVGFVSKGQGNYQFCIIAEGSPKVISLVRQAIAKDAAKKGTPKSVTVNGKPGFADNKARIVFYSPNTIILQGNISGNMPWINLRQTRKTRRYEKALLSTAVNLPAVLKVVPQEQLAGMPPHFKDISLVGLRVDIKGNVVSAEVAVQCKTAEAARFVMVVFDTMKQQKPELAQTWSKIKVTNTGNTVKAVASMTIEEIMGAVAAAAAPAAPAAPAAK